MTTAAAEGQLPRGRTDALARRFGLDTVELGALVALAGLSVVVLAALLTKGRAITGADGLLASDQLQYFTWIREASEHGLVGNRYDFEPDSRTFLHPGFLLSGLVHRITGLSVPLSYLLWKPVAVGVTFAGALLYVRRHLAPGGGRHTALLLVLFAVMPASAFVAWSGWGGKPRQYTFDFISGEMWAVQYLWGYLMTAIAVFLMPLVLLAFERWRETRSARTLWLAAAGALLVCWLQPWQGVTLALIVLAVEALRWWRAGVRPGGRRARRAGGCRDTRALLLHPLGGRPGVGARLRVQRGRQPAHLELALVGDRADPGPARGAGRAGLSTAGA